MRMEGSGNVSNRSDAVKCAGQIDTNKKEVWGPRFGFVRLDRPMTIERRTRGYQSTFGCASIQIPIHLDGL